MKIINPSVELYPQEDYTLEGIYKQIEKCARVSYKSEDKITETSSKAFVDNLIKAGHYAPLEFGTVYLKMPGQGLYNQCQKHTYEDYTKNKYSKVHMSYEKDKEDDFVGIIYANITTNFRVLVENGWTDDLKYLCVPTKYHEKRYCVKFTTDIGAAREFTRHRVFSFMQESTRYCNYSKGKFDEELTMIVPCKSDWNGAEGNAYYAMLGLLEDIETVYMMGAKEGIKPQILRDILPLRTKTELVMCGFEEDWKHFFDLRLRGTTGAPHPDAKYLAQETWNLFKDNYDVEL